MVDLILLLAMCLSLFYSLMKESMLIFKKERQSRRGNDLNNRCISVSLFMHIEKIETAEQLV